MSDGTEQPLGLAVRCDRAGTVVEVLLDTLGSGLRPGRGLTEVLGTASVPDALTLLTDAHRGLLTRPVGLRLQDAGDRLHVVGCSDEGDHVILVGTPAVEGLQAVVDALTSHLPGVHERLRQLSAQDRAVVADADLLDAMSATNNDLVSMHRELARAHAELARVNSELDQLNRRKDEILAMVAHDLRNPLVAVAGFGQMLELLLDEALDDTSREILSRIQVLTTRMHALVDDLLDTAAIESDALHLELHSTDLGQLLSDTVANHEHAATAKGLDLHLDLAQAPAEAWVDDSRLAQVIDNLVSNAIKFSPADVNARVTVTCSAPDPDHVVISVRDEGMGLSAEDQGRLFEPFATRSRNGTANERGTGLGLAITQSIIKAHGGTIEVESEVGVGSTFTVTLPRQARDLGDGDPPSAR